MQSVTGGVVHVAIRGDAQLLDSLGVPGIETPSPKSIDYLAVRQSGTQGRVVGGLQRYQIGKMSAEEIQSTLFTKKDEAPATQAYANGSYYNTNKRASILKSSVASIGPSNVPGADLPRHVNIPEPYAGDYTELRFSDGSSLTVAPVLSENGQVLFAKERLDDPKYQFSVEANKPGSLVHASHPNPRTAVVLSMNRQNQALGPTPPGSSSPTPISLYAAHRETA